jgi:four helix bundle protein
MATIKRFEDLDAWKLGREVCNKLGILIANGVFEKNFRLIGQIEGSSGSIMDNIAEGFERGSKGEFLVFLGYSKGSCGELRSQLYRALDRKYLTQEQFEELYSMVVRISAMLQKFITYLQHSDIKGIRRRTNP